MASSMTHVMSYQCPLCGYTEENLEDVQAHVNAHGVLAGTSVQDQDSEILIPSPSPQNDFSNTKWPHKDILQLIELRKSLNEMFENGPTRKSILCNRIAAEISKTGLDVSGKGCRKKWDGLWRTYKKVKKKHNNTSGNNRRMCCYYNNMDEWLGERPDVASPFTLSSESASTSTSSLPEVPASPSPVQRPKKKKNC
ncbi:trihelix transcription factor GTL1-like [Centruroides sculpturatus]|uniref:trihelix transcription factor GTL1-like n=1 Tax=Centruroides sculpturatus TaxID=218467 RepID=UPI000C6E1542|nr:trihelix transcription factor GTL1-like [Centruroides sculpturatus]